MVDRALERGQLLEKGRPLEMIRLAQSLIVKALNNVFSLPNIINTVDIFVQFTNQ
jgi:hypothetical protein